MFINLKDYFMKTRKLDLSGFIQNELCKEETLQIKGGMVGDPPIKYPTPPAPGYPIPPMPPLTLYPAPGPVVSTGNGAG